MASCLQDNHFIEWAVSPKPSALFGLVKMSVLEKMVFHFCLLTVHWAAECSIAISLLPPLLWACFVLTPEAPWLLDSLILQVSQPQSLSPNQAGLWLVFFFFSFLLLTKVHTVLNTKLQQMGAVHELLSTIPDLGQCHCVHSRDGDRIFYVPVCHQPGALLRPSTLEQSSWSPWASVQVERNKRPEAADQL